MENKFNVGDSVNLKSDKVNLMTVSDVNSDSCTCIWFDVTIELQEHDFKFEVLEKSELD